MTLPRETGSAKGGCSLPGADANSSVFHLMSVSQSESFVSISNSSRLIVPLNIPSRHDPSRIPV